jgi:hypothetical protein
VTDRDCRHLGSDGICQGKYKGFGCIGDRCKDPTRGPGKPRCRHGRADGYCKKHRKFECAGEDCPDFEA